MSDKTWTIGRVLNWAADDFRGRGFDSSRLDAELLLAKVLHCDRIRLILDNLRPLSPDELASYRELIQRRRRNEPIAYILGKREFFGLEFKVDSRVLVPRPDTETLVTTALERSAHRDQFGTLLDLCTGSGCVAVCFALKRPTWQVWASDTSAEALQVARDNALRLGAPQIAFRQGNLFDAIDGGIRFAMITANPPYIPQGDIPGLAADIREFEPHLALDGGEDGLQLVRGLVDGATRHLVPGGVLAMEIGHDQAERTRALMNQAGFVDVETTRDYGGHERVVSGKLRPACDD